MAVHIKDKSVTPREGWLYEVPGAGYVTSPSYSQLYPRIKQRCEANKLTVPTREEVDVTLCQTLTIECYESDLRTRIDNKFGKPFSHKKGSKDWPWFLIPAKILAQEGDKGLGDIVTRTVGPIGGDLYKRWHIITFGKPCGCQERQEDLNRDYPL